MSKRGPKIRIRVGRQRRVARQRLAVLWVCLFVRFSGCGSPVPHKDKMNIVRLAPGRLTVELCYSERSVVIYLAIANIQEQPSPLISCKLACCSSTNTMIIIGFLYQQKLA